MLDIEGFWAESVKILEAELPAQQFSTWIQPLSVGLSDDQATVALVSPNRFILKWIKDRYLSRIQAIADHFFEASITVKLIVVNHNKSSSSARISSEGTIPKKEHSFLHPMQEPEHPALSQKKNTETLIAFDIDRSQIQIMYERTHLNQQLKFSELVRGKANDLAHAAARQVAESPGKSYNPLFIYGGVGLGKTHILQAVGNWTFHGNPTKTIRYIHANDYYADVVKAYQQGSFDTFARYYRSLDVLLIDDIQFFNNKTRTQEEFFHAFNALIEAKKQIIITCDTYPKDITGLSDRLISRFDWGLTVAIEPPEPEMRVAILKKKAETEGIILDEGVSFFIAKHLKSNVRELEGALNKVLAYARFHGRDISLDLAKEALKDLLNAYNRQITIELIQKMVADYYKIKVADLYSKKRTISIARPRQIAMALARELTPASLPSIGDAFGGRDHTTVLHACRNIARLRAKDPQLNHDIHVLSQTLKG